MALSLAFALGSFVTTVGRSEGAVKRLDCRVRQVCDGSGRCDFGGRRVSFAITPVSLAAGGGGLYRIEYGDVSAEAQGFSDAGPFYWRVSDQARDTLIASSEKEWLWHEASSEPGGGASVSFLVCTLQQ